jgi:Domain of unknown function (DUF5069)
VRKLGVSGHEEFALGAIATGGVRVLNDDSNCPLDQRWLKFAEIDYDAFRSFVATGATDEEIAAWIGEHARKRAPADIIIWNNKERDLHLSDLPPELQEFMEDYIRDFVPRNRVVYHWFDVYDLEEERF